MSVIISEEKREPFEPAWYRAAREAEASDFLRDDDRPADGKDRSMQMLAGCILTVAILGAALLVKCSA